jgi:hypothetical protein
MTYQPIPSHINVLLIFVGDCDFAEVSVGGYNDWGLNRSSKDNTMKCRGFPWTDMELNIVRDWKLYNPLGSIKGCLQFIYSNEVCRKEFHIHHVINTARLLTAWRKF